jgi:bile acid:Na+ symporter, BASS family
MLVIPFSILSGILIPQIGQLFSPYLLVLLGALLFLNLLKLELKDLGVTFAKPKMLLILSLTKLLILPLLLYSIAHVFFSAMALPVLLLSGISTGLGAPFVVNFVGGRLSLVVGLIISTSIAVPFILPTLVFLLFKTNFSIQILDMMLLLTCALFIPLALGIIVKKYSSRLARIAEANSLGASIGLMVLINFAMFASYSSYFLTEKTFVLHTILVSFLLYAAYGLIGYLFVIFAHKNSTINERISGFIAMTYINNVLVVVFAQHFFSPQVAALAAFYNIPYYVGILVLKKWSCAPMLSD